MLLLSKKHPLINCIPKALIILRVQAIPKYYNYEKNQKSKVTWHVEEFNA